MRRSLPHRHRAHASLKLPAIRLPGASVGSTSVSAHHIDTTVRDTVTALVNGGTLINPAIFDTTFLQFTHLDSNTALAIPVAVLSLPVGIRRCAIKAAGASQRDVCFVPVADITKMFSCLNERSAN